MEGATLELRIRNVVATVELNCKVDLVKLAMHARNAEFSPKRFSAVIMKIREPKSTALVFANGKMVITGAKSTELSKTAAKKHARIVQKVGFPVQFTKFRIQNVVGTCELSFPIRLELFSAAYPNHTRYEPELFPAAFYDMTVPKVKVLVFVSGKIVVTGARSEQDIRQAMNKIRPIVREFRQGDRNAAEADQELNDLEEEHIQQMEEDLAWCSG